MEIDQAVKGYWDSVNFQDPDIFITDDNEVYKYGNPIIGFRSSIYWTPLYATYQYFYNEHYGFGYSNNFEYLGDLNLYYRVVEDCDVYEGNTIFLTKDLAYILQNLFSNQPKLEEIKKFIQKFYF